MMKKLACIVGTRPQFIKYAVLRPALAAKFTVSLLHTGQHTDPVLNDQIFEDLEIPPPDGQLNLPDIISADARFHLMKDGLIELLEKHRPDAVIHFGDTDSTLAGVLASEKTAIFSVHIEAGERSHNPQMPEENNRLIADRLCQLLCCASQTAVKQLQREGLGNKACFTGDLMKDLLLKVQASQLVPPGKGDYYFASIHRNYTRENESMLKKLFRELNYLDAPVFFSLHPSTSKNLNIAGIREADYSNIRFLSPLNYSQSIQYQKFSKAVITDSGGMQKEAYWLMKPCITLRKETEWTETLSHRHNQLYYGEGDLRSLLFENQAAFDTLLYGNGQAADSITKWLETAL
ncbi:MAG TPA: UDP-N-acetylglucosamine 2-epimerase [Flavitalea sp.]|nr:UDP-N-acetylglucosamine 2-epimerase [Flavitalea sp.]